MVLTQSTEEVDGKLCTAPNKAIFIPSDADFHQIKMLGKYNTLGADFRASSTRETMAFSAEQAAESDINEL